MLMDDKREDHDNLYVCSMVCHGCTQSHEQFLLSNKCHFVVSSGSISVFSCDHCSVSTVDVDALKDGTLIPAHLICHLHCMIFC